MSDAASMNPFRAGRYIHQPAGYRAFIPAPLPPDPAISIRGELQSQLSKADRALGRLDGSIHTLPHPDLFVAMYVRKEAVLSSQIEGTQSSLQDVLAAEAKVLAPERPHDVDEVFNYIAAMNYGLDRLASLPVSVRLIREIHERLLRGVLEHLCQNPVVRVKDVKELTGTTYPAANDLVTRLEKEGVLEEMTGQKRNRRFLYRDYLNIFSDQTQEPAL